MTAEELRIEKEKIELERLRIENERERKRLQHQVDNDFGDRQKEPVVINANENGSSPIIMIITLLVTTVVFTFVCYKIYFHCKEKDDNVIMAKLEASESDNPQGNQIMPYGRRASGKKNYFQPMTKGGMSQGFVTPDATPGMTPGNYNDMLNLYNQQHPDQQTPGNTNQPQQQLIDEILQHRQALTNTRKRVAKSKVRKQTALEGLERIAEADVEESYVNGILISGPKKSNLRANFQDKLGKMNSKLAQADDDQLQDDPQDIPQRSRRRFRGYAEHHSSRLGSGLAVVGENQNNETHHNETEIDETHHDTSVNDGMGTEDMNNDPFEYLPGISQDASMKTHKMGAQFSKPKMLENYRQSMQSVNSSRSRRGDHMALPQESPTMGSKQFSPLKLMKNDPNLTMQLQNKQLLKPQISSANILNTEQNMDSQEPDEPMRSRRKNKIMYASNRGLGNQNYESNASMTSLMRSGQTIMQGMPVTDYSGQDMSQAQIMRSSDIQQSIPVQQMSRPRKKSERKKYARDLQQDQEYEDPL